MPGLHDRIALRNPENGERVLATVAEALVLIDRGYIEIDAPATPAPKAAKPKPKPKAAK